MKPTFSIIFFTVISGAGLGLLSLLSLSDLFPIETLPRRALSSGIAAAFALISVGLASSTLHLAKPSNAWRAFSRFRTSWLSREAVLAALLVAVTLLYAAIATFSTAGDALRLPVAAIVCVLCVAVLFCTAMIYASLKPIRQWHTHWTPACYVLLGHWSGALLLLALVIAYGAAAAPYAWLAAVIGIAALVAKLGYWHAMAADAGMLTLARAIGVHKGVDAAGRPANPSAPGRPDRVAGQVVTGAQREGAPMSIAQARLFDLGHSHGTFLTHEFGFTLARRYARALRALSLVLVFALPPLAWIAGARSAGAVWLLSLLCILGLLAERWLFFAEARHTVRLYHGDART